MKSNLLVACLVVIATNCFAQSGTWHWAEEGIPNSKTCIAEGYSVAEDINHDVVLTGFFDDTITIGPYTLSYPTEFQGGVYLAKYDTTGKVLWARQSESVSEFSISDAHCVGTDSRGNYYIAGMFFDTVSFGAFKVQTSPTNGALFLVKYDNNGNVKWAVQNEGVSKNSRCIVYGLAVDSSGNTYLTGGMVDTMAFGSITVNTNGTNFFLAKYDSSGNAKWVKQPKNGQNNNVGSTGYAVAMDRYKNVYVTGDFFDSLVLDNFKLYSPSIQEIFVARLDSNGNTTWLKPSTGQTPTGYVTPMGITASNTGGIYLTGAFFDSLSFDNEKLSAQHQLYPSTFLFKFNSSGITQWAKQAGSSINNFCSGYTVTTDNFNRLYLTLGFYSANFYHPDTLTFDTSSYIVINSPEDGNSAILMLDSLGNVLCGSAIGGGGDDNIIAATDPLGKYIYFGGDLEATIKMGPDSLPYYSTEVPFMSRWQSCNTCNIVAGISQPVTLCPGSSDTLKASGGTDYTWSPLTGLSATTGSVVIANPTVNTTYEVVVSTGSCVDSEQTVVTVLPAPNIPSFTQHGDTLISSAISNNQWFRNDSLLNNGTSQELIIDTPGWYFVVVSNEANGCSTSSDSAYINLSGIDPGPNDNSAGQELSVYPNPATDAINLILTLQQTQPAQLSLYNVLGQQVYNATLTPSYTNPNLTATIPVTNLPDAMYILKINCGGVVQEKQVVVAR